MIWHPSAIGTYRFLSSVADDGFGNLVNLMPAQFSRAFDIMHEIEPDDTWLEEYWEE